MSGSRYDAAGEMEALRGILDGLPIYATKIGYRTDSTDEQRAFGDAMFKVHEAWTEVRAAALAAAVVVEGGQS